MKISTLLFLSLILIGCSTYKPINDLNARNLKGNIKSTKKTFFTAVKKSGKVSKGEKLYDDFQVFNKKGEITDSKEHNLSGNFKSKTTYKYDNRGNNIETNNFSVDGLEYRYTYKYDDSGNEIELNKYNADGSFSHKAISIFNEKGKKTESNSYYLDDSFNHKTTYTYNEKGNNIETNSIKSNGLKYKYTYKYDNNRNIIETSQFMSNGKEYRFTYKYDKKGNITETNSYNSDGSFKHKDTYKYDVNGNEIETNRHNSEGIKSKHIHIYEYDIKKNWIKRLSFENDEPKFIIEREIEYYN